MSLQNKFLTVVLVGLLSVYFVSVLYQRHSSVSTVSHFAAASKAGELERQWRWVDCVQQDMATGLEAIMATGDMDLFSQSMQQQAKLPGLVEASLTDFKARVQYSTIPSRRRQDLPVEVKQALWQNRQALKRQVDGDFEIYQPLIAQGNCVSCHTERRPGDILGVLTLRFTGKDLQAAEAKWDGFQTDFKRANAINSLLTGGILAVIMAILVIVCVRRFLDRPLHQAADDLAAESRQVNVAAGQLSESSQSLAAGASELAASLEESSASLAELTSTTARNNAHAEETRKLARLTHNAAQESVQRMEQLTTKIDQIKDSSNEIGKINKLINEIAFQTNLL
ncbi:MAG TPA: methyl-accepting chemotaxis protein, partial [Verrucomicrobiae bacterium]